MLSEGDGRTYILLFELLLLLLLFLLLLLLKNIVKFILLHCYFGDIAKLSIILSHLVNRHIIYT